VLGLVRYSLFTGCSMNSKQKAIAEIATVVISGEGRLYPYKGARYLALKGEFVRMLHIRKQLNSLGIKSTIHSLNGRRILESINEECRLSSFESGLLSEVEYAIANLGEGAKDYLFSLFNNSKGIKNETRSQT
jgi:hypothetical protein